MSAVLPAIGPTGVNHHIAWETLTHATMRSIGLSWSVRHNFGCTLAAHSETKLLRDIRDQGVHCCRFYCINRTCRAEH
jgi:hypothetical protein